MLCINELKKTYNNGEHKQKVLTGVTVVFPNEGFYSILGKSGSGKTTLLNLIGGIDTFDSGEIILDGLSYSDFVTNDWDKIRTNLISFVFQEYNLLDQFTIIENLRFAVPNTDDKYFDDALTKFDLIDKRDMLPNQLSGGEKQRIAIIRSLLKKSKIILVDEPTGNLDDETSLVVMDFLKEITSEKLVIMITHDKDMAYKYSDEVMKISGGKLIGNSSEGSFIQSNTRIELTKLTSLQFSIKTATRLAIAQLSKKIGRNIQYILMFSFTLLFLGLQFSLLYVNEFSVAADNLIESNTKYYSYEPIYINNDDEQFFFRNLNSSSYEFYNAYGLVLEEYNHPSSENSFLSIISGYIEYYDQIEVVQGGKPVDDNEVLISDYLARALELDFGITNIIGWQIPETNIIVSGTYKTDYEEYLDIFESNENFMYNDEMNYTNKAIASYKANDVYSIVYTSESFNYKNTLDNLKGFLPDISSETVDGSVAIGSLTQSSLFEYSIFNDVIQESNDIYISKEVLSKYIQRDLSFGIDSDEEFDAYWEDHEQELVEYIKGKEVTLSQNFVIKDLTYYYGDVVVKGVYVDSNPYKARPTIQISDEHYNMMYKSDCMYVITNDDSSDLEDDMKLLYDRNYEYDGFNLHNIINFKEDTRPVITNIAIGLSLFLSLFSILLFTNLLSRDVISMKSEIGLLRTIGIKMRAVSKLFVIEICAIGSISWLISLVLHPIGLRVLNYIFAAGYSDLRIVTFDIRAILISLVAIIIIVLITIITPFRKLSKLKLIDCIKRND